MFFTSKKQFQFEDIPDLSGKVAIITGASAGIGKVNALEMARKNCEIIFACRNKEKTEAVIREIKEKTGNKNLEFIQLDMTSLKRVQQFVSEFLSKHDRLDILLNNAGVGAFAPTFFSQDGINYHFGINHVAHHYLTVSLLPLLQKSEVSRIVNVASNAHEFVFSMKLDEINTESNSQGFISYGRSKAANILFTRELAKRLQEKGIKNIYVNCNHPGAVASDIFNDGIKLGSFMHRNLSKLIYNYFAVSPEEGALTQLYLCTSPDIENNNIRGEYYIPTAKLSSPTKLCSSEKESLALWDFTEKLIKEKLPGYEGANI